MRRLATIVSLAALAGAFIYAQFSAPRKASADAPPSPIVVAQNVAVRALAVNSVESNAALYLTNADSPDQVFTLATTAATAATASASATPSSAVISAQRPLAAVAGTGASGSLGDGGTALNAQFDFAPDSPVERSGVAIAPDGTVYIADTQNSTVRAISSPSSSEPGVVRSVAGRWAEQQNIKLVAPMGVAVDRDGNLFIADRGANAVVRMVIATGDLKIVANVVAPSSIAVAPNGKIFVASAQTGGVFSIDSQTSALAQLPGFAAATDAAACATGTAPATGSAVPNCPSGLATDGASNLYIANYFAGQIVRIDAQTGQSSILATGLTDPGALTIDSSGDLYVAEEGRTRLLVFPKAAASQGNIALSPATATFINEPTGGTTATQTFTLTNNSATALSGLNITINGTNSSDFALKGNSCSSLGTLAANGSCTINAAFTPQAQGARSATLSVTDSVSTDLATTALSGTGDDYEITVPASSSNTISAAAGTTATFNLQVVPDSVFGANGEKVSFVCPTNMPNGVLCSFSPSSVTVKPGTASAFKVLFTTTNNAGTVSTTSSSMLGVLSTRFSGRNSGGGPGSGTVAFVAIAAITLLAGILTAIWVFDTKRRWSYTLAACALTAVILAGCHHSVAASTATPVGSTNMNIQGLAQDVNGNSLNASRSLTITLDVTAN